jgi:hypothetical protein
MVSPLIYCHIFITHLLSYTVPFKGTDYTIVQRLHMSKSAVSQVLRIAGSTSYDESCMYMI